MSSIGQYRKESNLNTYYTDRINDLIQSQQADAVQGFGFDDNMKFKNIINTYNFQNSKSYYLKFKVQRRADGQQVFDLRLKHSTDGELNSNTNSQIIQDKLIVPAKKADNKNKVYTTFEVVFSPNENYDQLYWRLYRSSIDFIKSDSTDAPGRAMNVIVLQFYELIDLIKIKKIPSNSLTKIGVQGPPSLLMCINKEPIRIGKSGIYEINNGIIVNSICFYPKTQDDFFIIDYQFEN